MTADESIVETYFDWLRDDAFSSRAGRREYEGALKALHDIPFYWTLWSDENRAGDALAFRQFDFLGQQTDLYDVDQRWLELWASATPSVLEVLMGVARRWHLYFEGAIPFYFGHLWRNMEFDRHPGKNLTGDSLDAIRLKADIWMSRQFQPNGQGSPFPVANHLVFDVLDMREIEIWSQMSVYSAEHFQ